MPGDHVIDFTASFPALNGNPAGYEIDLGNGTLNLASSGRLLRASIASADLQIGSYVSVHGGLAFESSANKTVTLSGKTNDPGVTKTVSVMTVGASGLSMFVGTGGPYFSDIDHDGHLSWALPDGTSLTDASGNPLPAAMVKIHFTMILGDFILNEKINRTHTLQTRND